MEQYVMAEFQQQLVAAQSGELDMARKQVLQLQGAVTQMQSERDVAVAAAANAKSRYVAAAHACCSFEWHVCA